MLRIALASVRRNPALFTGQFVTVTLTAALLAINGEALTAVLSVPGAGGQDMGGAISVLALGGVVSAFVAVTGLLSSTGLTVTLRRRNLALLRLIGSSGGQICLLIVVETLVLSVVAGLLGTALGRLLVAPAVSLINLIGLSPVPLTASAHPAPLVIAWVVAVVLSVGGAALAADRASRIAPAEAWRNAEADGRVMTPGRWIPGTLMCADGGR